jgi:hypothetical protein
LIFASLLFYSIANFETEVPMDNGSYHEDHERILEYHKPDIALSYREAMEALNQEYVKTRHLFGPLEFAVLMHCHVRDRLQRNFEGKAGAKPIKQKGRAFKVELDGTPIGIPRKLVFKAKKINHKLLTANIPTKAVKNFNSQQPEFQPVIQYSFFGDDKVVNEPEPAHFNAGYIPNALFTGFDRICITYLVGLRSAHLVLEIPIEIAGESAQVISLPLGEITDAPKEKRVKPRRKVASAEEHKRTDLKHIKRNSRKKQDDDKGQSNKKAKGNG